MKTNFILFLVLLISFTTKAQEGLEKYIPKDGDIIFHQSKSDQSPFIRLATKSKYTHCGIIHVKAGKAFVIEAEGHVMITPLKVWQNRGVDKKFVIKRLFNASQVFTPSALAKMKSVGITFLGKLYDKKFEWSDDKIYCSELVWKIYDRALGIKIGTTQTLKDFNLSNKNVFTLLSKRYQGKIPYDETVISPVAIFDSKLLVKVAER